MGEVALLKILAVFYQNKQPQRFFRSSPIPVGLWKLCAVVCLGHGFTDAKFLSSFKILLVSDFAPVLLGTSIRALKT